MLTRSEDGETVAFPDTLVGTDSHTTMINGLGVLGWGVGGIEAEAVMLGQPLYMLTPAGGRLQARRARCARASTATDLVLTVTQMLRKKGVVEKFVEFYGPGLARADACADRATIANMAPEYGATCGFFPVDDETLALPAPHRPQPRPRSTLVERYCKEQGLFRTAATPDPVFTDTLELDLATVEPSLAGPKRPQDRVRARADEGRRSARRSPRRSRSAASASPRATSRSTAPVEVARRRRELAPRRGGDRRDHQLHQHLEPVGDARRRPARAEGRGARPARAAATSRRASRPGSKVVTEYLAQGRACMPDLEALGFHVVGYGCTTCIGNSGPLPEPVVEGDRTTASWSPRPCSRGNRNFEGRINPDVKANYLASPPLVVAYALAGTDGHRPRRREPLGNGHGRQAGDPRATSGRRQQEVADARGARSAAEMFRSELRQRLRRQPALERDPGGRRATSSPSSDDSTYIQEPPFFQGLTPRARRRSPTSRGARVLAVLGDSVTTDHISPAGDIALDEPGRPLPAGERASRRRTSTPTARAAATTR